MISRNYFSIILIYFTICFLAFMSLGVKDITLASLEPADNETTDLSLADLPSENLSFADNSSFLLSSTYLGGTLDEHSYSVTIDSEDAVIITGLTTSDDFPVMNGYDETFNGTADAFVTKFSKSGELIWSTFLGGTLDDQARSIAIDSEDAVIVTGRTESDDFPVMNGFDETFNGESDIFVVKFNSSGSLIWSTFLGGSSSDWVASVSIDSEDAIILAGITDSIDFPILNAFDDSHNDIQPTTSDGFISKFASSGNLLWSTYLGGTDFDKVKSVTIDSEDNILVVGWTYSTDFPILNAYDEIYNAGNEAFVTKFNGSGGLIWSTYLGGIRFDEVNSVTVDTLDNVIIAGRTNSYDFPILNGFAETLNGDDYDVFITKFNASGSLIWSTFFGGLNGETAYSVDVDSEDAIIFTGSTWSSDFPILNAYDETLNGSSDAFVTKFDSLGHLLWSTYLGGILNEIAFSVDINSEDAIIITGQTTSIDFPILNAYDESYNGDYDIFVVKMLNPTNVTNSNVL